MKELSNRQCLDQLRMKLSHENLSKRSTGVSLELEWIADAGIRVRLVTTLTTAVDLDASTATCRLGEYSRETVVLGRQASPAKRRVRALSPYRHATRR